MLGFILFEASGPVRGRWLEVFSLQELFLES
jgi:hypothetical protein